MAGYGEDESYIPLSEVPQGGQQVRGFKNNGNGIGADQVLNIKQRVGTSHITLFTADEDKGGLKLPTAKSLQFRNEGGAVLGVQVKLQNWTNVTTENTSADEFTHLQFLVRKGEIINFPMSRIIASVADGVLTGTEDDLANTAPDSNRYRDSGANLAAHVDSPDTTISVDNGSSFRIGDLIQLGDDNATATKLEVMQITAIADPGADGLYTPATLTVVRGLYGSNINDKDAQTDGTDGSVVGANVYLPFFNTFHDFDKFSTARTDHDGKFKAFNFFGYGRGTDFPTSGLLPGSIAIKCYNPGYQEWGMSGVTPGTHTGLSSTTYKFNITVDGGTTFEDLSFTTDANNLNFGGRNGVLSKIQAALDTQYYTAGNLFTKKITVGIVNGDVRFTSGTYLSTSAILLAAPTSGTTPFGVGRIPAIGVIDGAVAAKLPDDTISDPVTGNAVSNSGAFMFDDGYGRLVGNGRGSINYDSGAIDFISKPNAEFVVSVIHTGALAGKVTETTKNTILEIKARSLNTKIEGKINVVIGG